MNYLDLRDYVIEVTHNLQYAPTQLVENYLTSQWELRDQGFDSISLEAIRHPSIKSVVHCMMHYDDRRIHTVRSILVDDVPAFFYIKGGREGTDYFFGYILDKEGLRKYVRYLAVMAIELWHQKATGFLPEYLPEVEDEDLEDEDMQEVDECTIIGGLEGRHGVQFLYGARYKRLDCLDVLPDDQWVLIE